MVEETLMKALFVPFELLLFLILVSTGIFYAQQTPLNDITKAYLEVGCVHGGFTQTDINNMKSALADSNYNDLTITITPSSANDISPSVYAKRGTIITLQVTNNKLGLIDALFKKIGDNSDIKNNCKRTGMSEKS